MKTCVLLMIWYNFFLSLNLNADSKTYCTRHSRSICSLFYMGQIRKATFNQQQKYSEGERERERKKESSSYPDYTKHPSLHSVFELQ